jgi:hypothetical protein
MREVKRVYKGNGEWVHVPPAKSYKADKPITLTFAIEGYVPAKKNTYTPTINKQYTSDKLMSVINRSADKKNAAIKAEIDTVIREVKPFIFLSKNVQEFLIKTKPLLQEQAVRHLQTYSRHNLVYPITLCSMKVVHYWKDRIVRDNVGRAETIQDLFTECQIISDDRGANLFKTSTESNFYVGEIPDHITMIY